MTDKDVSIFHYRVIYAFLPSFHACYIHFKYFPTLKFIYSYLFFMQQKAEFDVFFEVRFLSNKLYQHVYVMMYFSGRE